MALRFPVKLLISSLMLMSSASALAANVYGEQLEGFQ